MLRGGICAAVSEDRAAGPFLVEMCILHSRTTVGTALSSAKCASRRQGAPAAAAARPAAPLRGILGGDRGGASCPNLLQRPRSRRSARRESLIFRASAQRRSRRETPLQQSWTRPRPGPSQEPHQYHPMPAHPPSPRRSWPMDYRSRRERRNISSSSHGPFSPGAVPRGRGVSSGQGRRRDRRVTREIVRWVPRSPLNPRARLLEVRARGSSDVLADRATSDRGVSRRRNCTSLSRGRL